MAIKINLLPKEFKVGAGLGKALRLIRILGVISLAAFLIFGMVLGGYLIISSVQLNSLNSSNDSLKSQLKNLETSESQLVVLKDRLSKIKTAENTPSGLPVYKNFDALVDSLSDSTTLNTVDIGPTKLSSTLVFRSNQDLTNFVEKLTKANTFQNIALTSFSFNPNVGYLLSVEFVPK